MAKNRQHKNPQPTPTPAPTRERVLVVGPTGKKTFIWREKT